MSNSRTLHGVRGLKCDALNCRVEDVVSHLA